MSLKTLREAAGLSQIELGKRLAIELGEPADDERYFQPRISAYETGRNRIPLPIAVSLTKVLNKALAKAKSKRKAAVEDLLPE